MHLQRDSITNRLPALEGSRSARGVSGWIFRQLARFALSRHRAELIRLFQCAMDERTRHRDAALQALDTGRHDCQWFRMAGRFSQRSVCVFCRISATRPACAQAIWSASHLAAS
ncbi:hypothetical protein [Paraburkholderia sartisoli]|uniref:hypothetical protein n=1 Tax=Paraburkholderia sartisoli TaxID=83784 RepID=UPI0015A376F9|nr:hypothetical protein [Paraburkholderia sartisoli]